ncbi:hypothetical protein ACH427_27505 [Streptomyces sp. NPDC020379]|uniref:hypothetical protein n=1 Tax=Streptomyces sp. NPDC020379 TaxID=3365071 RepID=UPI00379A98D8
MTKPRRAFVVLAMSMAMAAAGAGSAFADQGGPGDNEGLLGGVLSNVGSFNATGHGAECGSSAVGILVPTRCVSEHKGGPGQGRDNEPLTGGLLSNLASYNASGHALNCGNPAVGVLTTTTCVSKHTE